MRTAPRKPENILARFVRLEMVRWLVVLLIAPLLVLGALSPVTSHTHCMDEPGVQLHLAVEFEYGVRVGACHGDDHGHRHVHHCGHSHAQGLLDFASGGEPNLDECDTLPCYLVGCFVPVAVLQRSFDSVRTLRAVTTFVLVAFVLPRSPDLDRSLGSPGGLSGGKPMDMLAITASDRLVRTSRALLI